jgi:hypothetical protein
MLGNDLEPPVFQGSAVDRPDYRPEARPGADRTCVPATAFDLIARIGRRPIVAHPGHPRNSPAPVGLQCDGRATNSRALKAISNMAMTAKIDKQEDRLPLERALRALEDVHKSLKEFSKTDTVAKNDLVAAELKTVRHKAKKLRERANALARLCGRGFEANSSRCSPG